LGSGAKIDLYTPSFIKICSGIQKLIRGTHRQIGDLISLLLLFFFFQNKKTGLIIVSKHDVTELSKNKYGIPISRIILLKTVNYIVRDKYALIPKHI
jgi:hypothetical protein